MKVLFYNLPGTSLYLLQSIQNFAARIICKRSLLFNASRLLHDLHWLPVKDRIVFKILVITFKTLSTSSPVYLRSLITFKSPARTLRGHDHCSVYRALKQSTWATEPLNALLHACGIHCHLIFAILLPFRFSRSALKLITFLLVIQLYDFLMQEAY